MLSKISSIGLKGIEPFIVSVEVDSRRGLPTFNIVGMPDTAVRESRERVRSAVQNLGYPVPTASIVANLAPAGLQKSGAGYDLAILLALISACKYEEMDFSGVAVIGEIGLSGELRGVRGVLPMVLDAAALGLHSVIVPAQNAAEAGGTKGINVYAAAHAGEIVEHLTGRTRLPLAVAGSEAPSVLGSLLDMADVKGQHEARRALEIAAAGGHNALLIGPPGAGKSMLAKRLPSILPQMTEAEAIETTKLYSVAGELPVGTRLVGARPFRAPHHSASTGSLTGGGVGPIPGEISLAHNGVLFLDEMPEFEKTSLEVLRQPLEDGQVLISRVKNKVTYPSRFMLVAAMNPCPCGYFGSTGRECSCSDSAVRRYLGRISGPMLDRLDIHIEVLPVEYDRLSSGEQGESSADVRARVSAARTVQQERYKSFGVAANAMLTPAMLGEFCALEPAANKMLRQAFDRLGLSARGHARILKVARTIADLDGADNIAATHIAQAIQLRSLDRKYWKG